MLGKIVVVAVVIVVIVAIAVSVKKIKSRKEYMEIKKGGMTYGY